MTLTFLIHADTLPALSEVPVVYLSQCMVLRAVTMGVRYRIIPTEVHPIFRMISEGSVTFTSNGVC